MIEDQVLKPDSSLIASVAWGLYEVDPRAAIATLGAIRPPAMAAEALLDLADRAPEALDESLNLALALAREVETPDLRVTLMAKVADRRFAAGEPEKGRALIEEARSPARKNTARGDDGDAEVVGLVVPFHNCL